MGCKVDTLIERHGLTVPEPRYDSVDEFLVARWTGQDGRSAEGYKSLTEWFNKRVLKRIYESHGRDTMSAHLGREYELITGESDLQREELAADLSTKGLDIEELDRELISWSTMRHHLKGCLDAEKQTDQATTDWEANAVQIARERTEEKTRSVLSSLSSKQRLPNAERAEVQVQVKLACPDCSVRVPFEEAVDRGYVCETHFEAESEDPIRERWKTTLSGIATPYGIVEAAQTFLLEEPFILETLLVPALSL